MNRKTGVTGVLVCAAFVLICASLAFAASTISVPIPVSQSFIAPTGFSGNATFQYTIKDSSDTVVATFSLTGNEARDVMLDVPDVLGTYTYTVSADPGNAAPDYTIDSIFYTVRVWVDNTGQAVVEILDPSDLKVETAQFAHAYTGVTKRVAQDPPVTKRISGAGAPTNAVFTFTLTAANATNPMPEGSVNGVKTITITGAGTTEFGDWEYTEPGVYVYQIAEKNTAASGWTYDTTIYTMTDTVTADQTGSLVLVSKLTVNGSSAAAIEFTNSYRSGSWIPPLGVIVSWLVPLALLGGSLLWVALSRKSKHE